MVQNKNGTGSDPMAQLDAAMNETFAELAQTGSGVSPADVAREAPPRERSERPRRRAARPEADEAGDGSWLEQEQGQGREAERRERPPLRRRPSRPAPAKDDPSQVILDEVEEPDEEAPAPAPRRRAAGPAGSQRDEQGRFLPRRTDTDEGADEDDDEAESDEDEDASYAEPARSGGRRSARADEAEDDEDDFELEGGGQAEDDEEDERTDRRGRRRFPKAVRREIDRRVKAQVGKVVEERDKLRTEEQARTTIESQALDVLMKAIGTQEQRQQLQAQVNNTRLPIDQRNKAAALLTRYQSNEQYIRTYHTALQAADRQAVAKKDQEVLAALAKYRIKLDPVIVAKGDRHETLVHAVRQGMLLERAQNTAEIDRYRRALANRRGSESELQVRGSRFGRPTMASSNGRRANGRVAQVDRLRGAFGNVRGLDAKSEVPMPTDRVLAQLRDGEITLADLGLG